MKNIENGRRRRKRRYSKLSTDEEDNLDSDGSYTPDQCDSEESGSESAQVSTSEDMVSDEDSDCMIVDKDGSRVADLYDRQLSRDPNVREQQLRQKKEEKREKRKRKKKRAKREGPTGRVKIRPVTSDSDDSDGEEQIIRSKKPKKTYKIVDEDEDDDVMSSHDSHHDNNENNNIDEEEDDIHVIGEVLAKEATILRSEYLIKVTLEADSNTESSVEEQFDSDDSFQILDEWIPKSAQTSAVPLSVPTSSIGATPALPDTRASASSTAQLNQTQPDSQQLPHLTKPKPESQKQSEPESKSLPPVAPSPPPPPPPVPSRPEPQLPDSLQIKPNYSIETPNKIPYREERVRNGQRIIIEPPPPLPRHLSINVVKATKIVDDIKKRLNNSSDEIEAIDQTLKVSLNCPITSLRVVKPCRSIQCHHFDCFDIEAFLNINYNKKIDDWKCPKCKQSAKLQYLFIDSLIEHIITHKAIDASVESVIFDNKGYWVPDLRQPDNSSKSTDAGGALINLDNPAEAVIDLSDEDDLASAPAQRPTAPSMPTQQRLLSTTTNSTTNATNPPNQSNGRPPHTSTAQTGLPTHPTLQFIPLASVTAANNSTIRVNATVSQAVAPAPAHAPTPSFANVSRLPPQVLKALGASSNDISFDFGPQGLRGSYCNKCKKNVLLSEVLTHLNSHTRPSTTVGRPPNPSTTNATNQRQAQTTNPGTQRQQQSNRTSSVTFNTINTSNNANQLRGTATVTANHNTTPAYRPPQQQQPAVRPNQSYPHTNHQVYNYNGLNQWGYPAPQHYPPYPPPYQNSFYPVVNNPPPGQVFGQPMAQNNNNQFQPQHQNRAPHPNPYFNYHNNNF